MSWIRYVDMDGRWRRFRAAAARCYAPELGELGAVTADGSGDPRAQRETLWRVRGGVWVRVVAAPLQGGAGYAVEVSEAVARGWLVRLGFGEESEMKRAGQLTARVGGATAGDRGKG